MKILHFRILKAPLVSMSIKKNLQLFTLPLNKIKKKGKEEGGKEERQQRLDPTIRVIERSE